MRIYSIIVYKTFCEVFRVHRKRFCGKIKRHLVALVDNFFCDLRAVVYEEKCPLLDETRV